MKEYSHLPSTLELLREERVESLSLRRQNIHLHEDNERLRGKIETLRRILTKMLEAQTDYEVIVAWGDARAALTGTRRCA